MLFIAVIGIFTALFAGADRDKTERHQTRSGLLDPLAARIHGPGAGRRRLCRRAMFHLTTHAFFKALLFLGAGSVIHALCGEQDMRNMGGLKGNTEDLATMCVGWLAISGIPPLAGFWSKDEILR